MKREVAGSRSIDRDHVGAEGIAEIGIVAQRFVKGLADQIARQRRMVEPLGDAMHHRIFQPFVMQHGRIDEGGEFRLAADDVFRLGRTRSQIGSSAASLAPCGLI